MAQLAENVPTTESDSACLKPNAGFFAITASKWREACALGMNPPVTYLILAQGTERDNQTTAWSVNAVEKYTGISRGRAHKAIDTLIEKSLIVKLTKGIHPRYSLTGVKRDKGALTGDLVWLPNSLVTGAAGELSPVERLRQTQDVMNLRLLIDFYRDQNLREDGGIRRSMLWRKHTREKIGEKGEWTIFGFAADEECKVRIDNETVRPHLRQVSEKERADGISPVIDFWPRFFNLERLGLIEWISYLYESDVSDAEPIHPCGLGSSESMEDRLGVVAHRAGMALLTEDQRNYAEGKQLSLVPVLRHRANVQLIGIARLRYRPKTRLTSAWWADLQTSCDLYEQQYRKLGGVYAPR